MHHVDLGRLEADELTALAQLDLEAERLDQALVKLKLAVAQGAPGESQAMLGRLYARLGLFERAKETLAAYLESHPEARVSRFQYAMVCLDMGDLETALQILDRVLVEEPQHPPALFHKALLFARQGEKAAALNTLEALLKSADTDNLFYGRGTELKAELEGGEAPTVPEAEKPPTGHSIN